MEPPIDSLSAYVWEPWEPGERRVRGLSNATLGVYPGRLEIEARSWYRGFAGWSRVTYDWPVVVIETLRPFLNTGILFEMEGQLGSCAVSPLQTTRLRTALEGAGFSIVEFKCWGWERPRPVPARVLGAHVNSVPPVAFLRSSVRKRNS